MTMRAYGLPRESELSHPDKVDCMEYGFKSRIAGFTNAGIHSNRKRQTRRIWKKRERARNKDTIRAALGE